MEEAEGHSTKPRPLSSCAPFPALLLSFSQAVTKAPANTASSWEGPLLHHVYLHEKVITNKSSQLTQKALLQAAGGLARLDCSLQSCLLSYRPRSRLSNSSPILHPPTHHPPPFLLTLACQSSTRRVLLRAEVALYVCQSSTCCWAQKAKLTAQRSQLTTLPVPLFSTPPDNVINTGVLRVW